ncbi:MAG: peptidylprolyl isomerase, partial [Alphaproteobacteria bacterium]
IKAGDMVPQLREAALRTEAGRSSAPIETPAGILIFMVCDRTEPATNLPTRDEVRARLSNEQVEMMARRYLRDLRFAALVDLRV